jgi:hypothetical protein
MRIKLTAKASSRKRVICRFFEARMFVCPFPAPYSAVALNNLSAGDGPFPNASASMAEHVTRRVARASLRALHA